MSAQQMEYVLDMKFSKSLIKSVSIFFTIFIACSCAIPYKGIKPSNFNYQNNANISQKIQVSYVYDIQRATNNRRYAKKEQESGYSAISLQIKNISDQPVIVDQSNFKIYSNGKEVSYVSSEQYASTVKQRTGVHLLHGLWGPWGFHANGGEDKNESRKSEFIYLPIGLAVGVTNFIIASSANKKHLENLHKNELIHKTINPGEIIYGIVIIAQSGYEPLTFEF